MNDVEKAERIQAWKAFLIPATLFVACLFNAAGIYIMYTGNSVGMVFLGFGFAIIVGGMFAFITFHNNQRAEGKWKQVSDELPEHLRADENGEYDADEPEVSDDDRTLAGVR